MKQLICLASEPWQPRPTRTQHLMTRLRETEVLFFEPPSSPGDKRYLERGRRVRPGITVFTLPPIPPVEERHACFFRWGQRKLARYVGGTLARRRIHDPVLWATSPAAVHLTEALPLRGLVYDCDRVWDLPIRWESDLALAADVVFAASPGLAHQLEPCNDNIALLPNGSNYTMFGRDDLPVPPELLDLKGPVLGFLGDLRRDLDVAPLLHTADAFPGASFLLIGGVEEHPQLRALEIRPNIRLLGPLPLVEQPNYVARFNVCLDLPRRRDRYSDVIPPRIFEYLCTGNPIVSMLFPGQVEPFPDVVYSAHSCAEFSQLCGRALLEYGDWARNRRREHGAAAAWSARAGEVTRILETIGLF